ncbi:MAG: putative nucleotidyltransferase substrate binding domain-containing protein [Granulosicoccaceae bacterium]|jgi:CBS domain-containing protein
MDIELQEIRDFLAGCSPFASLPGDVLDTLPRKLQIRYLRRGSTFPPAEEGAAAWIIRQGAVELRDAQNNLVEKLAETAVYATACSLGNELPELHGTASEDCLVYVMPCGTLKQLCQEHAELDTFFQSSLRERLQHALASREADTLPYTSFHRSVSELAKRAPVCCPPGTSIRDAAQIMSEEHVSALLITEGETLLGIVTDRDLRKRCLAAGLDPRSPVKGIMTTKLCTIDHETSIADALLSMSRDNVHHLPIIEQDRVTGLVSSSDLLRQQSNSPMHLISAMRKADSVEQLARLSASLPEQQHRLLEAGATASQVGHVIAAIGDALARRLFDLVTQQLGPAPIAYSWFAIGSLARRELTSHSDQDNALILAEDYDAQQHGEYFAQLAKRISDGLDACGFYYCPGDVMATNPEWRQPLRVWKKYFSTWVDKPEPKALLFACNFFDMRLIHGDPALFSELQEHAVSHAHNNHIFHAFLASNAMQQHPPLGFFRQFVLIHDGKHDDTFDLKLRALMPITDLARLFALVCGSKAVNTYDRIRAAGEAGLLSRDGAANLLDALELIAGLRLRHQVSQYLAGLEMDNYVNPHTLSPLERSHLKDAFAAIRTIQETVAQRYQTGRF